MLTHSSRLKSTWIRFLGLYETGFQGGASRPKILEFIWILLIGISITNLMYWPILTTNIADQRLFVSDFIAIDAPNLIYAIQQYGQGCIPFWNPYSCLGIPALGNGEYYPLVVLMGIAFRLVGHSVTFFDIIILTYLIHTPILIIGMFYLCRTLKLSVTASTLSAVMLVMSGMLVAYRAESMYIMSYAWVPWTIMFFVRSMKKRHTYDIVLCSLSFALVFLGGFINVALYLLYFLVGILVYNSFIEAIVSKNRKSHVAFVAIVGCGIGFSLVYYLPMKEMAELSVRFLFYSGQGFRQTGSGSWPELLSSIFYVLDPKWENVNYVWLYYGLSFTLLLIFGVLYFFKREPIVRFSVLLITFAILFLCLGKSYFDYFSLNLPFLSSVRWHSRGLVFVNLLVAILLGFFFDRFLQLRASDLDWRKRAWLIGTYAMSFGCFLAVYSLFAVKHNIFDFRTSLLICFIVLATAAVPFIPINNYKTKERFAFLIMFFILLADIGSYSQLMLNSPYQTIKTTKEHIGEDENYFDYQRWKAHPNYRDWTRIRFRERPDNFWEGMGLNIIWKVSVVRTYNRAGGEHNHLFMKRHLRFYSEVPKNSIAWGLQNTRNSRGLIMPRAFWIEGNAKVFESGDDVLEYLKSSKFDAGKEIVLEEEPWREYKELTGDKGVGTFLSVPITAFDGNVIHLESFRTRKGGFLFVSDNFYPGWHAYDTRGKKLRVYRANYFGKAVFLPPGQHNVTFVFRNDRAIFGALIGMILSIGCLIWIGYTTMGRKRVYMSGILILFFAYYAYVFGFGMVSCI